MATPESPEFGPSGYLPEKASKRARKIVLRAPLGLQWIIASVLFGGLVLVAGLLFLTRSGPPAAPYVAAADLTEVGDALVIADLDVLVVTAGGPIAAFADATALDLTYCPTNRRIEGGDGQVWGLTGRGYGVASLARHPATVHDGMVYVDPTTTVPGSTPLSDAAEPACR